MLFAEWASRNIEDKVSRDRRDFTKRVVTLSSSAIFLSFAFLQIGVREMSHHNFIKTSWILFGAAILAGLFVEIFRVYNDASWHASMDAADDPEKFKKLEPKQQRRFLDTFRTAIRSQRMIDWFEMVELLFFVTGVGFLIYFLMNNV